MKITCLYGFSCNILQESIKSVRDILLKEKAWKILWHRLNNQNHNFNIYKQLLIYASLFIAFNQ